MRHVPFGIRALAAFFVFGAVMSFLACMGLLFPQSPLEPMWRLNPQAREELSQMGLWAVALMAVVSAACAMSATGLLKLSLWGYRLALAILAVNLLGDLANAILRSDLRTLIGLPIGGALIAYLLRPRVRGLFTAKVGAGERGVPDPAVPPETR